MIIKKTLFIALAASLMAGLGSSLLPSRASAFTPNYNQSNLIDNGTMLNKNTMSASQIQAFLNSVNSGIKNYTDVERCSAKTAPYYHHCNQRISAAQIIYDAAQAYSINPRAIIATMQKEEGLITNPNPGSFAITHAMGYGCPDSGGCSGYSGFFNQVDNGTWQFRVDIELGSGRSWWGYGPSSYPCRNSTHYYTPGLLPGNTVSFKDDYGTVYKTFRLSNASTASLYCYTPHAYPGSSREYYSGSYWFVYYFQKWFGSTTSSSSYAWNLESIEVYSNPERTSRYSSSATAAPGGKFYARIKARNVGYKTWSQSVVRLGTSRPHDRSSAFYDSGWYNTSRPALMTETSVAPGDVGTFDFILNAPPTEGTYREYFNLVADGVKWFNDVGLFYTLNVVQPFSARFSGDSIQINTGDTLRPGDYLISPGGHDILIFQKDGNLVLYNDFKAVWNSHTSGRHTDRLTLQGDGNLVLYEGAAARWSSGTQDGTPSRLVMQADGNLVVYNQANSALWSAATKANLNDLSHINNTLPRAYLFTGQQIETADGRFRLVLQGDGNLVLYNDDAGKAIWSSRTSGGMSYLAMQGDGNLVLYKDNGKPAWYSGSGGSNAHLVIQSDGNLVIYDGSGARWSTRTHG